MGYDFRTAYALRSFGVAALGLLRPANRGKHQPKERGRKAKPEAEPGVVSVGIFEEVFAHGLDSIAKSSANGI